jgi:hypothetical protein
MTTEEKILDMLNDIIILDGEYVDYESKEIAAKEIAALIEPYQKLVEAQDELIIALYNGFGTDEVFQSEFDDFGNAITARWKTALNDFEVPDWQKTAYELWVTTRVTTYSIIDIYYYTDLTGESAPIIDTIPAEAGSYSWDTTTWDTGTWEVIKNLKTFKRKPKLKGIQVFSVEFRNDDVGKDLAISDLVVRYKLDRRMK